MTPETVMKSYRSRTADDELDKQIISDDEGLLFINDGIRSFLIDHQECGLLSDGTMQAFAEANKDNMQTALILSETYFEPLVNYVCMRRFAKDSGDARDENRAKFHQDLLDAFWKGEQ
jgi:hypothetical protein